MSSFRYSKVSTESSFDSSPIEMPQPIYRRNRCCAAIEKLGFLRWPVTFFLLSIIMLCQLSILHSQEALGPGVEFNGLVPEFSTEKKVFHIDKRYRSDHKTIASINATKREWEELLPLGAGFIDVPNYDSHQLPPPMHFPQAPGKQSYSIAVFHELHCLMHIAAAMDDLIMQIRNRDFNINENRLLHNDHCFDYIRNAIMCFGDTTLEGQSMTPGIEDIPGTDGTGAIHICRNFDEVSKWAEVRRLNERKEHLR